MDLGFFHRITAKLPLAFASFFAWSSVMATAAADGLANDRLWEMWLAALGIVGGLVATIGVMVRFAIEWFTAYGKRIRREGEGLSSKEFIAANCAPMAAKIDKLEDLVSRHDERLRRTEVDMQKMMDLVSDLQQSVAAIPDAVMQRLETFHEIQVRQTQAMLAAVENHGQQLGQLTEDTRNLFERMAKIEANKIEAK